MQHTLEPSKSISLLAANTASIVGYPSAQIEVHDTLPCKSNFPPTIVEMEPSSGIIISIILIASLAATCVAFITMVLGLGIMWTLVLYLVIQFSIVAFF